MPRYGSTKEEEDLLLRKGDEAANRYRTLLELGAVPRDIRKDYLFRECRRFLDYAMKELHMKRPRAEQASALFMAVLGERVIKIERSSRSPRST